MASKSEKATALLQNIDSLLGGESSVEITHTSRGDNWKVKIYHPDAYQALEISNDIYDRCREKYGSNEAVDA